MAKRNTKKQPQQVDVVPDSPGETSEAPTVELAETRVGRRIVWQAEAETVEAWCRRIVGLDDGQGNVPNRVRVEVRQSRHEKYQRLLEVPITGGPGTLADTLEEETDRCGFRDVRLLAYFPGAKQPVSIFVVPREDSLAGTQGSEEDELGEGPLSSAIVRQALRHNEVFLQQMMGMQVGVMRHLAEQNAMLSAQSERLAAERLELIEAVRQVKLEGAEELARAKRGDALVHGAGTLVDAVAFRLTGGKVAQSSREDTMVRMLQGIGKSLTGEQWAALQKTLTTEQAITLNELLRDPTKHADQVARELAKKDGEDGDA